MGRAFKYANKCEFYICIRCSEVACICSSYLYACNGVRFGIMYVCYVDSRRSTSHVAVVCSKLSHIQHKDVTSFTTLKEKGGNWMKDMKRKKDMKKSEESS